MAVHIFVVSEENYEICIRRGIVGLPEPKETSSHDNVFDGLISRIACVKENDYILMYVIGAKELRGVWRAEGLPFYDTEIVWNDRVYPFRCKIKVSEFCFDNAIKLNDINDLRNNNKIWTWALQRSSGANAMFSISNSEFEVLIYEFLKINPFTASTWRIMQPYYFHEPNLLNCIHIKNGSPQYEYSVMSYLNFGFSKGEFKNIFGNYTDYLSYVPTNLGREMDILLMYGHPKNKDEILSYDIIEVKRNKFDREALKQLIDYESWFLMKKVSGDLNMVRTSAIAESFSDDVIHYVQERKVIENKTIKLITYHLNDEGNFILNCIHK